MKGEARVDHGKCLISCEHVGVVDSVQGLGEDGLLL
jgi:hypothetical protein